MPYSSSARLADSAKLGALVWAAADPTYTSSSNGSTDNAAPGVNSSGYPGFTRASGTWAADGFAVGNHVRVTGAAMTAANGSDAAPKVWRIAYLSGAFMGVEGANSANMTDTVTQTFTIRRVRLFKVANLRSIQGAAHPVTLQATVSPVAATTLQASLDGGVTWDNLPNVALPDTNNANAKIIQFFVGYEALLMVLPGASITGSIYAG